MNLLPRISAVCAVGVFILASNSVVVAQDANNPYRQLESAKPVWPPFYKPDPKDGKYLRMLTDGWCKPTGRRAREFYLSKLVDVNRLPEFSFEGKVASVGKGALTAVDARNGERLLLMIHENPAISRVSLEGRGSAESLAAGVDVRFVGRVDASGTGSEMVDRIEVISAGLATARLIEVDKLQPITGKVVRRDGNRLILLTASAKLRRVSIELSPEAEVSVRLADYRFARVGDFVRMKGRILRSTVAGLTFCFADDLDIAAAAKLGSSKAVSGAAVVARKN